jgi:hypothetical protein
MGGEGGPPARRDLGRVPGRRERTDRGRGSGHEGRWRAAGDARDLRPGRRRREGRADRRQGGI